MKKLLSIVSIFIVSNAFGFDFYRKIDKVFAKFEHGQCSVDDMKHFVKHEQARYRLQNFTFLHPQKNDAFQDQWLEIEKDYRETCLQLQTTNNLSLKGISERYNQIRQREEEKIFDGSLTIAQEDAACRKASDYFHKKVIECL